MRKPKKSKAFIITFISIFLLLVIGYFLFANKPKTNKGSGLDLGKIFQPLLGTSKTNGVDKNNFIVNAQAGENIIKGDLVYGNGTNSNGNPVVMRYNPSYKELGITPIGKAVENINTGNLGEININNILGDTNIWKKFKNFLFGGSGDGGSGKDLPNVTISASPSSIKPGESSTISWSSENTKSCKDASGSTLGTNGSFSTGILNKNKSFSVVCKGENGSASGTTAVLVFDFNTTPACSDSKDNDKDGFIDTEDPQCHVDGDLQKAYVPTHTSESINASGFGDGTLVYTCSDSKDNDKDGFIDTEDPQCHVDGDLQKAYVPTHTSESINASGFGDGTLVYTCSDSKDNDKDGFIDTEDPQCHVDGDLQKAYVPTHTSESINANGFGGNLPNVTISASPSSVKPGESSTISWSSENTKSCKDASGSTLGTNGSFSTGILNKNKSFSVVCKGENGSASGTTAVLVFDFNTTPACSDSKDNDKDGFIDTEDPQCHTDGDASNQDSYDSTRNSESSGFGGNLPNVTISASPSSIKPGESSTISWSSVNTKSCDAGEGNGTDISGSFNTGPLQESKSYSVTCSGDNGDTSRSIFVNVETGGGGDGDGKKYPSLVVSASPNVIKKGESSNISWDSVNTKSCNVGGRNNIRKFNPDSFFNKKRGNTNISGSFNTGSLNKNTSYPVVCESENGQISRTAFVIIVKDFNSVCSDKVDNDKDGLIDIEDPQCHTDGDATNPNSYVPTHYSESSGPYNSSNKYQCNNGRDDDKDGLIDEADPQCHTDENPNNPKSYVPTHNSESVKPGPIYQCSDGIDNDGDGLIDSEDPQCHTDGDATNPNTYNKNKNSELGSIGLPCEINNTCTNNGDGDTVIKPQCSNGIDDDGDDLIDSKDPSCHTDFNINNDSSYDITIDNESLEPETPPNACLIADTYPLEYKDEEKARLAELLRKFYLIAPTLKTEDDIKLTYNEIESYEGFKSQIEGLTNLCVEQKADSNYTGEQTTYGNPWYKYDDRGTYAPSASPTVKEYETLLNIW